MSLDNVWLGGRWTPVYSAVLSSAWISWPLKNAFHSRNERSKLCNMCDLLWQHVVVHRTRSVSDGWMDGWESWWNNLLDFFLVYIIKFGTIWTSAQFHRRYGVWLHHHFKTVSCYAIPFYTVSVCSLTVDLFLLCLDCRDVYVAVIGRKCTQYSVFNCLN